MRQVEGDGAANSTSLYAAIDPVPIVSGAGRARSGRKHPDADRQTQGASGRGLNNDNHLSAEAMERGWTMPAPVC